MRFGVLLTDGHRASLGGASEAAEAAGFDAAWISPTPVGNPFALVAAVAGSTTGLSIGVVATVGDIHPLHTAEEIALADHITAGRLTVALVSPPACPPDRFVEAVAIIRAALRGGPFRHDGAYYTVPAGLSEHEGARHHALVQPTPTPAQIRVPLLVGHSVDVPDTDGRVSWPPGGDHRPVDGRLDVAVVETTTDTPSRVAIELAAYRESGFDLAVCHLPGTGDELITNIGRLGRLVLPRLRALRLPPVILEAMEQEE